MSSKGYWWGVVGGLEEINCLRGVEINFQGAEINFRGGGWAQNIFAAFPPLFFKWNSPYVQTSLTDLFGVELASPKVKIAYLVDFFC